MTGRSFWAASTVGRLVALTVTSASLGFAGAADFDPHDFGAKGDGTIAGGWNRYDYGREATSVHDLLFEDIEMKEIYGRPIYSFIESADKGTRCAGIRDITFRNVRARALELPLWCGRADVPTRNIVYDRCAFMKVSDDVLPGYRRHGAFWDRFPGRVDCFTENFTTNASSFCDLTVN